MAASDPWIQEGHVFTGPTIEMFGPVWLKTQQCAVHASTTLSDITLSNQETALFAMDNSISFVTAVIKKTCQLENEEFKQQTRIPTTPLRTRSIAVTIRSLLNARLTNVLSVFVETVFLVKITRVTIIFYATTNSVPPTTRPMNQPSTSQPLLQQPPITTLSRFRPQVLLIPVRFATVHAFGETTTDAEDIKLIWLVRTRKVL